MKTVTILGSKGGTTKTASSHLLCLGAYLHGIPAAYVLTDPTRKVRGGGEALRAFGRSPAGTAGADFQFEHEQSEWLAGD